MVYLRKPILEVEYSNHDIKGNKCRIINYKCPSCQTLIEREDQVICNNCDTLFDWNDVKFIELKPCPFCGAKEDNIKVKTNIGLLNRYYILCTSCMTSTGHFETRKQAIEAWNRRESD